MKSRRGIFLTSVIFVFLSLVAFTNTNFLSSKNRIVVSSYNKENYMDTLFQKFSGVKYHMPESFNNLDERMWIRISYDKTRKFEGNLNHFSNYITLDAQDNQSFIIVNTNNLVKSYNLRYAFLYFKGISDFPFEHPFELLLIGLTSTAAIVDEYKYLIISIPIVFTDHIGDDEKYFDEVFVNLLNLNNKNFSLPVKDIIEKLEPKFIYFNENEESEYNSALDKNFNFFLFKNSLKISVEMMKKFKEYLANVNDNQLLVCNYEFFNKVNVNQIYIDQDKLFGNFNLEKESDEIKRLKNSINSSVYLNKLFNIIHISDERCNKNNTQIINNFSKTENITIVDEIKNNKVCNKTKSDQNAEYNLKDEDCKDKPKYKNSKDKIEEKYENKYKDYLNSKISFKFFL